MKKILLVLGQLVVVILRPVYVFLVTSPLAALKRRREKKEKEYLDRAVPDGYRLDITRIANAEVNRRFLNDGNNFAKIVVWLMIRRNLPPDEVLIYSKALTPSFYAEIMRATALLDSKIRFRIVLDEKDGVNVINNLPEEVQKRIDFRIIDSHLGAHFLVTRCAYRYELIECPNELLVVCNFNEPESALRLRNNFEKLWANSVPLSGT